MSEFKDDQLASLVTVLRLRSFFEGESSEVCKLISEAGGEKAVFSTIFAKGVGCESVSKASVPGNERICEIAKERCELEHRAVSEPIDGMEVIDTLLDILFDKVSTDEDDEAYVGLLELATFASLEIDDGCDIVFVCDYHRPIKETAG